MEEPMIKVSVVIPVYNTYKYLPECLESVINQTLADIEIICINDGSTDFSSKILEEYASKDKRIKIISQNNQGLSCARNRGLEIARGEYIYFLDSDDKITLTALEELYDIAEKNKLDIIYFDAQVFFENEALKSKYEVFIQASKRNKNYIGIFSGPEIFVEFVKNREYSVSVCRQFFNTGFLKANNIKFCEGILHEDNLFTFLTILKASRVMYLKKEYFLRRVRANSTMTKNENFSNFEGYFVTYVNMLAYIQTSRLKDNVFDAAFRQLKDVYQSAKRIYTNLSESEKKKAISSRHGQITTFLYNEFVLAMQNSLGHNINTGYVKALQEEILRIRDSYSYRIDRFITFIPRKFIGGIHCIEDHGFTYTVRLFFKKIHKFLSRSKIIRFITFIPRKILGGIRCIHDHGLKYTVKLFIKKITNFLNRNVEHNVNNKDKKENIRANDANTITQINSIVKKDYNYYKNLDPKFYEEELALWFYDHLGYKLNLKSPRTFNEKIQWMKLYDKNPLKTTLADKYLVREWVASRIGEKYLVPLLGVWNTFDEIDFNELPSQFVLKANHGCGWNIIVKNKEDLDIVDAKKKMETWLSTNFAFRNGLELHYKDIKPKIIAEKYITNTGDDLYDYKVWCFNGKAKYIMFLSGRKTKSGLKMAFYDREWNKLPFAYSFPKNTDEIPKPDNLDEILELAEKLSAGFNFVRVDFYRLNDGTILFGEMTFTPAGGRCLWDPPSQDLILGEMIDLSMCKSSVKIENHSPLVSVIVPVYNAERHLTECISSICNQTLQNIEIILVDDGSTDSSLSIINEFAGKDNRIKVLHQNRRFAGVARNHGLQYAQGEYVIFLDADDFFDKTLLENAYYTAHINDADIVLFGGKRFNNQTKEITDAPWLLKMNRIPKKQPFSSSDIPDHIFDIVTPCPWTKMFRRSFILENKLMFQDTQNSNDVSFVLTALAIADRIVAINKDLVFYRVGQDNSLQTTKHKDPLCFYKAYLRLRNELNERNLFGRVEKSYVNITLSGCIHNLKTTYDVQAKKLIFDALKNYVFNDLGLLHYQDDYYYSKENLNEMKKIMELSYEEWIES